jgi:hypothetical protein
MKSVSTFIFVAFALLILFSACEAVSPPEDTDNQITEFVINSQEYTGKAVNSSDVELTKPSPVIDKQGNEYTLSEFRISKNGEFLNSIQGMITALVAGTDGNVYALATTDGYDCTLFCISEMKTQLLIALPEGAARVIPGDDFYTVYIIGSTMLFGYSNNTLTQILQFTDLGLTSSEVAAVKSSENNKILITRYNLTALELTPVQTEKSRIMLTIAAFKEAIDANLLHEIARFNDENSEYRIELKTYSIDDIEKLNTEIIAGNVPDMIDLKFMRIPEYKWGNYFVDLIPLIENDPELNIADFYLEMLKTAMAKESLYYTRATASMISAVVPNLSENAEWNWDIFVKESAKYEYAISLFRNAFLDNFYYILYNSFVDWENGSCNFDSQLFIDYINIALSLPDEYSELTNYFEVLSAMHDPGRTYTITLDTSELDDGIQGVGVSRSERSRVIALAELPLRGLPSDKGGVTILSNDNSSQIAIFNTSEHSLACWDFIRRFFTSEYLEKRLMQMPMSIAIRRDSQQKRMEKFLNELSYELTVPITDAELIKIQQLAETSMVRTGFGLRSAIITDPILGIIREELPAFFAGAKTAEETAKIVQSRASIYLAEQM